MTFQANRTAQDRIDFMIRRYNRFAAEIDRMYECDVHNGRLLDLEEAAEELVDRIEAAYAELEEGEEEGEEETYGLWTPTIEDEFAKEMAQFVEAGTHPQYGYSGDPDEDYPTLLMRLRGIAEGDGVQRPPLLAGDEELLEAARDAYLWKINLLRRVSGGPTVPAKYLIRRIG